MKRVLSINIYQSKNDKISTKTYDATGAASEAPDIVTNEVVDAQTSLPIGFNLFTLGGEYRVETVEADSLAAVGGKDDAVHNSLPGRGDRTGCHAAGGSEAVRGLHLPGCRGYGKPREA